MALINTPPWLIPTDVIGAMSAGGRLGLGSAELGERARESDQRTGLGYAQLGADQASAGARLQAQLAEHALAATLHQSQMEEEKRKNMATEFLRGSAIEEARRRDEAAEALRKQQFTELGKRQTQKEDAAMKLQRYKTVSSQLAAAQKQLAAAQANGDDAAASTAQQRIGELTQQMQEFSSGETPSGSTAAPAMTSPIPSAGESLFQPSPMPGAAPIFSLPQIPPGTGFIPMGGNTTKSGNRYSIEPVGE